MAQKPKDQLQPQEPQDTLQEEQNLQVCKHCGKTYPKNRDCCPFCQHKASTVEEVGNKVAYVRLALVIAIILAGFLFKCLHDKHQERKAAQTEQMQTTTDSLNNEH